MTQLKRRRLSRVWLIRNVENNMKRVFLLGLFFMIFLSSCSPRMMAERKLIGNWSCDAEAGENETANVLLELLHADLAIEDEHLSATFLGSEKNYSWEITTVEGDEVLLVIVDENDEPNLWTFVFNGKDEFRFVSGFEASFEAICRRQE